MMKKQLMVWVGVLCIQVLAGILIYNLCTAPLKKIAVVDAVELFNRFTMKTDLEKRAGATLDYYQHKIDSVENMLRAVAAKGTPQEAQALQQALQALREQWEEKYAESNRLINEQVWKRLNPLLDAYGRKEKLHVIIGANGMGTVLYKDDYFDKTEDLIRYVNQQYANGN